MLNDIAYHFLQATEHIIPNWSEALPHKSVTTGKTADPIKLEMVVRGFLCGHALRQYTAGERVLCGASMPDGMLPYQAFPQPIITPATKADHGVHDEDISPKEILNRGIVSRTYGKNWPLLVLNFLPSVNKWLLSEDSSGYKI